MKVESDGITIRLSQIEASRLEDILGELGAGIIVNTLGMSNDHNDLVFNLYGLLTGDK